MLTDREELNTQISDTFENCGLLGKTKASKFIATSGEDLINKLKGNPSFIFTLIQKFNKKVDEPIIPDHDIIIMSDEAHRSQYGVFADNMVELLPTASRIGFTGTPLLSNDNITERTFGGYISIYDFKRAVEDKATVPLYYENRGEKILDINNPDITDKILDAIEAADLDPEQEEKLEHEFEKEIHLLTAEPRLKSVARDFVSHYSDLWTSGKAMFVCLNKVTCVRMYDFVQKYWQDDIKTLEKQIQTASQQEVQELERKLNWMEYAFKILIDDNRFFYINEFAGLLFAKTTDATILERKKYYLLEKLRENNSEIEKCKKLIDVVVNILPEWKLEYILEFLKVNKKLEDFKKIDLFPSFCSWSGSEIPLIIEKIDFLKLLKDNLKGIDYIDHRKYIEEYRMDLEKYKEKIELREYIENADYA